MHIIDKLFNQPHRIYYLKPRLYLNHIYNAVLFQDLIYQNHLGIILDSQMKVLILKFIVNFHVVSKNFKTIPFFIFQDL